MERKKKGKLRLVRRRKEKKRRKEKQKGKKGRKENGGSQIELGKVFRNKTALQIFS